MAIPVMWRGTTTDGDKWVLVHRDHDFVLRHGPNDIHIAAPEAGRISVARRWWRTTVTIEGAPERLGVLHGLTREEGRRLEEAVREAFSRSLAAWTDKVASTIETARQDQR